MQPETGASLDDAGIHRDVVRLLKTDTVTIVIPNVAMRDGGVVTAIEEDSGRTATIHFRRILGAIAVNGERFHPRVLKIVSTDYGKHGGGKALVMHHDIGVHGAAESKVVSLAVEDRGADAVKVALALGSDVYPSSDREPFGILHSNRGFAEVTVSDERGSDTRVLSSGSWRLPRPGRSHGFAGSGSPA